jgi:uncharacterized membrane protein
MTTPSPSRLPESEYRWMSVFLRAGLFTSLGVLVAALVLYALTHPSLSVADAVATNPILAFLGISGLAAGLARGDIAAYLTVGLIGLVATPLLRVATGFYYFRAGRERGMQAITLAVFVMLLFGLLVLGPLIR